MGEECNYNGPEWSVSRHRSAKLSNQYYYNNINALWADGKPSSCRLQRLQCPWWCRPAIITPRQYILITAVSPRVPWSASCTQRHWKSVGKLWVQRAQVSTCKTIILRRRVSNGYRCLSFDKTVYCQIKYTSETMNANYQEQIMKFQQCNILKTLFWNPGKMERRTNGKRESPSLCIWYRIWAKEMNPWVQLDLKKNVCVIYFHRQCLEAQR